MRHFSLGEGGGLGGLLLVLVELLMRLFGEVLVLVRGLLDVRWAV